DYYCLVWGSYRKYWVF
nr:immunoglobulin light chain junction region [Macaca mulatta]